MAKRFKFRKFLWFMRMQRWIYDLRREALEWKRTLSTERGETSIFPRSGYVLMPLNPVLGKSLWAAFALLTFLAALTIGIAGMIIQKSWGWYDGLSPRITIQIPPGPPGIFETQLQQVANLIRDEPGVARMTMHSHDDSRNFLRPWIMDEQVLKELPIPRLLVVYPRSDNTLNMNHLKKTVQSVAPQAYIDDHKPWTNHLTTVVLIVGGGAFFSGVLSAVALCLGIIFLIRSAVAVNKDTFRVLCSVGAHDDFIAREFQRLFLIISLKGAAFGVVCAMSVLFIFGQILKAVPVHNEGFSFFLGQIYPNGYSYLALIAIGILVSGFTVLAARMTVYRQLEK